MTLDISKLDPYSNTGLDFANKVNEVIDGMTTMTVLDNPPPTSPYDHNVIYPDPFLLRKITTSSGTRYLREYVDLVDGGVNGLTIGSTSEYALTFNCYFAKYTFVADTTSGSATLVVGSSTNLAVGDSVSNANIPTNSTIASIISATSITISSAATATASSTVVDAKTWRRDSSATGHYSTIERLTDGYTREFWSSITTTPTAPDFIRMHYIDMVTGIAYPVTSELFFPVATTPAQTLEGSAVWDTNDDVLTIGTGSGRKTLLNSDNTTVARQSSNTGSITVPTGTTAQRDGTPTIGIFRRNSDLGVWEGYNGTSWVTIGGDILSDISNSSSGAGSSFLDVVRNFELGSAAYADIEQIGSLIAANGVGTSLVTVTAATHTVLPTTTDIIANYAGTVTETLPSAALYPNRKITIRTITANTVVSASSNVVPVAGGAAGTAILAATAGKWATLISDGTNWQIQQQG